MQRAKTALTIEGAANITMSDLVKRFYQADCSGSYAKNERLQAVASELLDSRKIDGVVYCVLKGQIEYDFELERLENLCELCALLTLAAVFAKDFVLYDFQMIREGFQGKQEQAIISQIQVPSGR